MDTGIKCHICGADLRTGWSTTALFCPNCNSKTITSDSTQPPSLPQDQKVDSEHPMWIKGYLKGVDDAISKAKIQATQDQKGWPGEEEIEKAAKDFTFNIYDDNGFEGEFPWFRNKAEADRGVKTWKAAIQWLKEIAGGGDNRLIVKCSEFRGFIQGLLDQHLIPEAIVENAKKLIMDNKSWIAFLDQFSQYISKHDKKANRKPTPSTAGGEKEEVIWEDMETGERIYPQNEKEEVEGEGHWTDKEVEEYSEWFTMCVQEFPNGDFGIHINDEWQQKGFDEIVDYYRTYHKPNPQPPTSGKGEELTLDVAKEMMAEYRYEIKLLKNTRDSYLAMCEEQEAEIAKLKSGEQEEVRKLVEVLGEIANFDTDDATYARDKAKEAIKPYIK